MVSVVCCHHFPSGGSLISTSTTRISNGQLYYTTKLSSVSNGMRTVISTTLHVLMRLLVLIGNPDVSTGQTRELHQVSRG